MFGVHLLGFPKEVNGPAQLAVEAHFIAEDSGRIGAKGDGEDAEIGGGDLAQASIDGMFEIGLIFIQAVVDMAGFGVIEPERAPDIIGDFADKVMLERGLGEEFFF